VAEVREAYDPDVYKALDRVLDGVGPKVAAQMVHDRFVRAVAGGGEPPSAKELLEDWDLEESIKSEVAERVKAERAARATGQVARPPEPPARGGVLPAARAAGGISAAALPDASTPAQRLEAARAALYERARALTGG
jgi:hypothetical protein